MDNYLMLHLKTALEPFKNDLENYDDIQDDWVVHAVQTLQNAGAGDCSFCHNDKYAKQLRETKAGVVLIQAKYAPLVPENCRAIKCKNAYYILARVMQLLYPIDSVETHEIHPSAVIDASAKIAKPCYVGAGVVIGKNVKIGAHCQIKANSVIEYGCIIGDYNRIEPQCTIQRAVLGNHNYLHSGVRIGGRGFGFATTREGHWDIPQIGRVVIGNYCEIGANSCIDRGALEDTILGDHVRIDAMVMVGHGAQIGFASIIAGQGGVAGSARIGKFVVIAAQSGVAGHIDIADFTQLAAKSGITAPTEIGAKLGGMPAIEINTYLKNAVKLRRGL